RQGGTSEQGDCTTPERAVTSRSLRRIGWDFVDRGQEAADAPLRCPLPMAGANVDMLAGRGAWPERLSPSGPGPRGLPFFPLPLPRWFLRRGAAPFFGEAKLSADLIEADPSVLAVRHPGLCDQGQKPGIVGQRNGLPVASRQIL